MADASGFDWGSLPWGSIIGGAVGYAGNSGSNTTTQTQTLPAEFSQLGQAIGQRGVEIGNLPYQQNPYNVAANFNPYQFAGFDMAAQRAQQQGGLPQQAESALGSTLSGNYLGAGNPYAGANPYLEQNIQNTLGDVSRTYNQQVAPTMAATAYKSGSFGNSGQQEMENQSRNMLQQNMGRIAGDMRMQDYGMQQNMWGQERNRMMQGLSMAPSTYGLGYAPSQQMLGIGATMQQQGQNVLDRNSNEFLRAQQYPYMNYAAMQGPLGRTGMNTSTTQPGGSAAAGLLGGAMLGDQLWPQTPPRRASFGSYLDPFFGGTGGSGD